MADAQSGYEIEVVSDVLKKLGYDANFVPIPYGRSYEILLNPRFDAVTTLSHRVKTEGVFLSTVYVEYQNVAISLSKTNVQIDRIADLGQYSLVAFQNAHRVLGYEFSEMSLANKEYIEVPDQTRQIRLFLSGRMEVIVMDVNIFHYLHNKLVPESQQQEVEIHPIFPINGYRMGFSNEVLNTEFNEAFAVYKKSPRFVELQKKYNLNDQFGTKQLIKE